VGVRIDWHQGFLNALADVGIAAAPVPDDRLTLVQLLNHNVVINFISINTQPDLDEVIAAQKRNLDQGFHLVSLWEDVWRSRQIQVLNRIRSLIGLNTRIHGRKTKTISLNKHQADTFLSAFHIQGPALARYKLGLQHEDELVAVATFSGTRLMRQQSEGYRSAELIRFATKPGFTVTGGLTKLIKHFAVVVKTNDIMSYADRDWSTGKGYEAAGFTFHRLIPPAELWLDTYSNKRYFQHRLPNLTEDLGMKSAAQEASRFVKIFNTVNLKYILYL
jgi:hypothetical protein